MGQSEDNGLDREAGKSGQPMFSVVIPVYNNARYTARAVISVLRQTQPVYEIILIDDASREDEFDRLCDYVQRCKSAVPVRLERLSENVGAGLARHRGANLASGTHVAFLDADDVWHQRKVEEVTRAIVSYDADLIGHQQLWKYRLTRADLTALTTPGIRRFGKVVFLMLNPMLTSSIVVRTALARTMFRFGGRRSEDHMALIIASRTANRVVFLDAPLAWALKPPFGHSGEGVSIIANYRGSVAGIQRLFRERVIGIVDLAIFYTFLAARAPLGVMRQLLYQGRYGRGTRA